MITSKNKKTTTSSAEEAVPWAMGCSEQSLLSTRKVSSTPAQNPVSKCSKTVVVVVVVAAQGTRYSRFPGPWDWGQKKQHLHPTYTPPLPPRPVP